jgi:hypothetical protein
MAGTDPSVQIRPWRCRLLVTVVSAAAVVAASAASAATELVWSATQSAATAGLRTFDVAAAAIGVISLARPVRNDNGDIF